MSRTRVNGLTESGAPEACRSGSRSVRRRSGRGRRAVVKHSGWQEWTADAAVVGLEADDKRLLDRRPASLAREATEPSERATSDVSDLLMSALEAAKTRFARVPWSALREEVKHRLNREAVSVRCLQTSDGEVPANAGDESLVAIVGRAY